MKNDRFILDLFLGELRSNCGIIKSAFNTNADASMFENVARSLKSSAKLVGFVELASLFAYLEDFFAQKNLFVDSDLNAHECVKILEEISALAPDEIESGIDCRAERIMSIVNTPLLRRLTVDALPQKNTDENVERPNIDVSMKELFVVEVSKQIELVLNTLVELENDYHSKSKLEALMRASHSIKGASRAVGLGSIVELTHQMENCFSASLNDKISLNENSVDIFFKCADFILELCKNGFSEIDVLRRDSLLKAMQDIENSKNTNAVIVSSDKKENVNLKLATVHEASYVRIALENINSIMALAAEGLIENRKFERFKDLLSTIKQEHEQISNRLEEAINMLDVSVVESSAMSRIEIVSKALREQTLALRNTIDAFSDYARKNVLLSSKLYREVLESRMRPFSDLAQRFPKMVRDFSRSLSKKISFEISGATASIDRDILEKLDAPLTHILRNACDHGIELPDERIAKNKNEVGKITIKASHSAGMFLLTISDDGNGIDVEKVKAKILARKLVPEEILEQMQEDEIFEFLFLPAFTTKENVTEISGRGVGLDVVQTMLREVGGSVSVESKLGKGCTLTLKLPITRSVLKSLLVVVDCQPYAFALSSVYRTLMVARSDIKTDERGTYFLLDKKRINLVDTAKVLGFEGSQGWGENIYVVVIAGRGKFWGFAVETIPSEAELVVRSLNTSLGKIACVSSAALGADGLPILIVDIDDILIYASRLYLKNTLAKSDNVSTADKEPSAKILIVDDSATVREVERKILENNGYEVDTAVDGVDGWNLVRLSKYDLVVSDIDMPRMTGFELTEKIRKLYPNLPIVIVSYKDRREDEQKGLLAGANAYLTKKSFQDNTFVQTINKLI